MPVGPGMPHQCRCPLWAASRSGECTPPESVCQHAGQPCSSHLCAAPDPAIPPMTKRGEREGGREGDREGGREGGRERERERER